MQPCSETFGYYPKVFSNCNMSRNYKFHNLEDLYFVSFAVVEWLDVFTRNEYKGILIESLESYRQHKGMEIVAWCVIINYMHLVFKSIAEGHPSKLLGDLKRFTSKALVNEIQVNPRESRKEFLLEQFKKGAQKSCNVKNTNFGDTIISQ